ncbi:MAG: 30S ribosomal protein S3 [Thermoprotei archaeon]|nr:30S ribosomal protein S3 [Thermoproteales archaeon]RLE74245.1 MAG: 30S ribosomal protein S3 [Thermoprotei archaeon]
MSVKKTFINQGLRLMEINEYLSRRLSRAGYIDVQIFRTPVGTRVVIFAERPPMVIGKRGITIKEIAQILEREFELENPQIDVVQIQNPELNAKIMAYRIARALARGVKFRRAAFIALRRIMEAGAQGAEIVISGKLTSERARFEKFRAGVIIKSGRPREEFVDEAVLHVLLKPGVYGVKVRIMPPVRPPDKIEIRMPAEQQPQQVG